MPGAGDQPVPAERLAGVPLMQPPGRRLRKSHPRASQRLRRGASPVQRLRCQCAAFRAAPARVQPVRADAPGAGRELRVDAHRDLAPAALLQGGQDRAPCQGPGLEAVRRARGAPPERGGRHDPGDGPGAVAAGNAKKASRARQKNRLRPGALRIIIDLSPRFRSSALFGRVPPANPPGIAAANAKISPHRVFRRKIRQKNL